ncbi:glutathione S-transferase Mu 1 [Tetranychus urticae]|uniref:glutathione transferase n=1 Tax=Tetranychus urticae TaxID=32264 RepID=T1K576_TETUR|nr:glutathione S-transferase Mu 1 [Tetranychus urticae]
MNPVIGYWTYRGNVEPILLLLKQADQPLQMKTYKQGVGRDYLGIEWPTDKKQLNLFYPNLPYIVDGDIKISQTLAILRYLARKHDLGPRNELETIRSDIAEQGAFEMMCSLWSAWYVETNQEYENRRPGLESYLVEKLVHTEDVLDSNKFILGDRVTYVDFLLYSTLDYIRLYKASLLDSHENLRKFLDRIEALPKIKPYFDDENFTRFPIIGSRAKFGHYKPVV